MHLSQLARHSLQALQADAYEEMVAQEAKRRLKIDESLGISGTQGAALVKEVERLKGVAWRPRNWTSADIAAEREVKHKH